MTDSSTIDATLAQFASLATSDDYEVVCNGLAELVRMLEQPGLGLNQSVRAYEIGRQLADRCQSLLDAAELRVTVLDGSELPSDTESVSGR